MARYPGFDLDDPDWPALRQQVEDVGKLLDLVKSRISPTPTTSENGLSTVTANGP